MLKMGLIGLLCRIETDNMNKIWDLLLSFSLEEDFVSWREQFWPAVCEHFGVEALGDESRFSSISLNIYKALYFSDECFFFFPCL